MESPTMTLYLSMDYWSQTFGGFFMGLPCRSSKEQLYSLSDNHSCCERNWSTCSFIHFLKKKNKITQWTKDLMFIHTNLRLLFRRDLRQNYGMSGMTHSNLWIVQEYLYVENLSLDHRDHDLYCVDNNKGNKDSAHVQLI